MKLLDDELVEAVAEEMWFLVRDKHDKSWEWCNKNDAMLAGDLRFRARRALVLGLSKKEENNKKEEIVSLDLRFKEAFVVADLNSRR